MERTLDESAYQAGVTVDITRKLETILNGMGAMGKGLHEKVSSIETRLPSALERKLRYVASVRNKLSHNDVVLPASEFESFVQAARDALGELDALAKVPAARVSSASRPPPIVQTSTNRGWLVIGVIAAVVVVGACFLYRPQSDSHSNDAALHTNVSTAAPAAADQARRSVDAALATTVEAAPEEKPRPAPPAARPARQKHGVSHGPRQAARSVDENEPQPADASREPSPGDNRIPLNTVRNITQGL